MSDGVLSQEEIDALLRSDEVQPDIPDAQGVAAESAAPLPVTEAAGKAPAKNMELTHEETDAISEVANIIMGSAATALSSLIGKKVDISTPSTEVTTAEKIRQEYPLPCVLVNVAYVKGLQGSNVLIIRDIDAAVIIDLMMGGDGANPPSELSELHLSGISEAMNQMMGTASTSVSTVLKERIEISTPSLEKINLATEDIKTGLLGEPEQPVVSVFFKLVIENLVDSYMIQVIPIDFAREMVNKIMHDLQAESDAAAAAWKAVQEETVSPEIIRPGDSTTSEIPMAAAPMDFPLNRQAPPSAGNVPPQMSQQIPPQMPLQPETATMPPQNNYATAMPYPQTPQAARMQPVTVQPAQFAPIEGRFQAKEPTNLDLIMDVPLQITVELGRARKTIRDILALGPGSVVELDKLAGEPVDILVNGKLLAKGEVVVIDENFGIRVTDIISPMERVTNLQ